MNRQYINWLITLLLFSLLALITFRCALSPDLVFSGSDLNIGRLAAKKYALPEMLTGYFTGNQVMGVSTYGFTLFHILLSLLPLTIFADLFYPLILISGSLFMVWFLRIWKCGWIASIIGALIAFWFNSITLASSGHAYKMEVLSLSVLSLVFIEKSIRSTGWKGSLAYSLFTGLSVAIMMIEQQDVALLAGLFIAPYTFVRLIQYHYKRWNRWFLLIFPVAAISLLISANTILKSYQHNIINASAIQSNIDEKWDYITQWSMVPEEIPDLVAPGWSGWDSGNQKAPYWGKIGQSADFNIAQKGLANFKLDSIYIGAIPFMLSILAIIVGYRYRKSEEGYIIIFLALAAIISLLLSFGKYSIIYKLFYQLPLVHNIRAPIKFLDNMQLIIGMLSAFGLHACLSKKISKQFIIRMAMIVSGIVLFLFVIAWTSSIRLSDAVVAEYITRCSANGIYVTSDMIINQITHAWLHTAVLLLFFGIILFGIINQRIRLAGFSLILILMIDSLLLTKEYFRADNISALKRGNMVIDYIKDNQEHNRSLFIDQSGIYHNWIAVDGPYNEINLFNIWQMPRMPKEYKEYLSIQKSNPIRLWELSSVKYIAAPNSFKSQMDNSILASKFDAVLNYQIPTSQGMRHDVLYELTTSIPRFALYMNWMAMPFEDHIPSLLLPEYNPSNTVLVDTLYTPKKNQTKNIFMEVKAEVSKQSAKIIINEDVETLLRFSQRYQPSWRVTVNGIEREVLRVDYLSMGVIVPPGYHEIIFYPTNGSGPVMFSSLIFIITLCCGIYLSKSE